MWLPVVIKMIKDHQVEKFASDAVLKKSLDFTMTHKYYKTKASVTKIRQQPKQPGSYRKVYEMCF